MSVQRPSVEEARAWIHNDLDRWHGEEYDTLRELLDDLVAAVRREAADEIREQMPPTAITTPFEYGLWSGARDESADLIDSGARA